MVDPYQLSTDTLVQIASMVQGIMYMEENDDGTEVWTPYKNWDKHTLEAIHEVMNEHDLAPNEVVKC